MNEIVFETNKPYNAVEDDFKNIDFFSGLMDGLQEALAYEQGKAKAETFARKRLLPEVNIVILRKKLKLSQRSFAEVLGVSSRTVESWESGRTTPSPTAKNLLFLIDDDPDLIFKLNTQRLKNRVK